MDIVQYYIIGQQFYGLEDETVDHPELKKDIFWTQTDPELIEHPEWEGINGTENNNLEPKRVEEHFISFMTNGDNTGSFPEVGQKQKTEKKNNGQATHGARKHAWRTQAAWAKRKSR